MGVDGIDKANIFDEYFDDEKPKYNGKKPKYIIKNCPCFIGGIAIKGLEQKTQTCNNHTIRELTYCSDITDCKLKQIVELCKDYYKNCEIEGNCIDNRTCTSCFFGGGNELAQDILSNLDIQEVE